MSRPNDSNVELVTAFIKILRSSLETREARFTLKERLSFDKRK